MIEQLKWTNGRKAIRALIDGSEVLIPTDPLTSDFVEITRQKVPIADPAP